MAKYPEKKQKKISAKPSSSNMQIKKASSLLENLDTWCDQKLPHLSVVFSIIFLLFSIFSFDPKLSIAFDDAMYMTSAYRIVHEFPHFFHTANAPLYPLLLSILVALFGFDMLLLKASSVIFMTLGIYFSVKALYKKLPGSLVFLILILQTFNVHFIWFSHHTFTESFFFMLQGIFLMSFFRSMEHFTLPRGIILGLLTVLLIYTRTVAIGGTVAIAVFFLMYKEWKKLAVWATSTLALILIFHLTKNLVWGEYIKAHPGGQLKILLQKDPYLPEKGQEDVKGFIQRFFDNYSLYISKRLYDLLSLKPDNQETSTGLGLFSLLVSLLSVWKAWREKNREILFLLLYLSGICGVTFFALQIRWDQLRLILPYFSLFVVALLYGVYSLFRKGSYAMQLLILSVFIILPLVGFSRSWKMIKENFPVAIKNLKGDRYAGLTPDWENYIKISIWAAENLDTNAVIACRKAPISAIYSQFKREFFNIHNVPSDNPDTLMNILHKNKVTHVIVASLRRDPSKKTEHIINTIHRFIGTIQTKYPDFITPIRQEGVDEIAVLYKINYPDSIAIQHETQKN